MNAETLLQYRGEKKKPGTLPDAFVIFPVFPHSGQEGGVPEFLRGLVSV